MPTLAPRSQSPPEVPTANVLLVDDHPPNLFALEAVLAPLGARLVRAGSGTQALECLLREDFAAIVLDVQMPVLDGFETAALIRQRERTRDVPILFVTAIHRDDVHQARGYAQGAVDYLAKPFNPDVLLAKVSALVALWQRGETLRRREARLHEGERVAQAAHVRELAGDLRESEARLRRVLEASGAGLWDLEAATGEIHADARMIELAGLPAGVAPSLAALIEATHPNDRARLSGAVAAAFAGEGGGRFAVEFRTGGTGDRAERWAEARGNVLVNDDAGPSHLAGAMLDVTPRKRAEEERLRLLECERSARAAAEEANELKDQFLATVSHELRTPLTAMLGWVQLLRAGTVPPERHAHVLQTVERNARAQAQIIEDLLDVSRILAGKLRLDVEPVDLRAVVEAALETVRPTADAKTLLLEVSVAPDATVMGDPHRLQQVLWNLLANAVKFTPRGGRVGVRVTPQDSCIEVAVEDSGRGIAPGFLPHVFERFRQADGTRTRTCGGLGLGLSIVRQLVEMHGGAVGVESEGEGRGARFTVRLPRMAAPSDVEVSPTVRRSTPPPIEPPRAAVLDGVRVVVVDDEEDIRELLRTLLEASGARVWVAASATEALRLVQTERPAVLLSDIGMPGEDGYALVEKVRALPPEAGGAVPAVAVTAYARGEDRTRALRAGFNVHLSKPVDPAELIAVVAELVGRPPR